MNELIQFMKNSKRFNSSLLSSIEDFRKGNDHDGLENFLNSIDDLESLLEINIYLEKPAIKLHRIISIIEDILMHMQNQDVIGMTDILEFELYPLAKDLVKGDDK